MPDLPHCGLGLGISLEARETETPASPDRQNSQRYQNQAARFRHSCNTVEREREIEGWWRRASYNIRTHAQPVGIEKFVPRPRLEIGRKRGSWRDYRARSRKPQEFAISRTNRNLWHKEVVACR